MSLQGAQACGPRDGCGVACPLAIVVLAAKPGAVSRVWVLALPRRCQLGAMGHAAVAGIAGVVASHPKPPAPHVAAATLPPDVRWLSATCKHCCCASTDASLLRSAAACCVSLPFSFLSDRTSSKASPSWRLDRSRDLRALARFFSLRSWSCRTTSRSWADAEGGRDSTGSGSRGRPRRTDGALLPVPLAAQLPIREGRGWLDSTDAESDITENRAASDGATSP